MMIHLLLAGFILLLDAMFINSTYVIWLLSMS